MTILFINRNQTLLIKTIRICTRYNSNTSDSNKNNKNKNQKHSNKFPEEPTTCCGTGCANCVWLEYAEQLTKYFKDGGEKAIKEINEKVSDPNIRAFLLHELRMKQKK